MRPAGARPGIGGRSVVVQASTGDEMAAPAEFVIGAEASCADGPCGKVTQVVIDPVAEAVTHLVVEPSHHASSARLVPLHLIEGGPHQIRLSCSRADFDQLDSAEETEFVPGAYTAYGPDEVLTWPYYGLGGGIGMGVGAGMDGPPVVTHDAVPPGEVSVRRGDPVYSTDGPIGHVQGLVIDRRSGHVTHVLLQEGHLWGRKDVAIPIRAVKRTDDGITLSISKAEVKDLPPVDIDRPPR
jgi:sporulation protein YlmC with PRC-barrel domain